MPLLNFTMFLYELERKMKKQTIRRPRTPPIKKGDLLHIYWKLRTKQTHKLGVGLCTKVQRKKWKDIGNITFIRDGFDFRTEAITIFKRMYAELHPDMEFDIISWEWIEGPYPLFASPDPF